MSYVPRRGDLVWLSNDPQFGSVKGPKRAAFVLSPEEYNAKTGLFVICPVTAKVKGYPFEVPLPPNLPMGGAIVADQLQSLDWEAKKAQLAVVAPEGTLEEVLALITPLVGLHQH